MTFNDWNNGENSLFYELRELSPTGVISIIGDKQLDFLFSLRHGNKEILTAFHTRTIKEVAEMIKSIYCEKWNRLASIYLNDLEIGFDSSTTTETNLTDETNRAIETNQISKSSAFNTDELSDTSGNDDSVTEIGDKVHTGNVVTKHINVKSIDFQRGMLENSNINTVICDDIASIMTIYVY